MSKKLNKSFTNSVTPKNTLLSYFSKSPATAEKKKLPKTPSQEVDSTVEKENVANGIEAKGSPQLKSKPLTKKRNLERELQKAVNKEKAEENQGEEEEIGSNRKRAKRRRIAIQDSDSSDDENNTKEKDAFADSDGDDEDYKASSDSEEESEDNDSGSNASLDEEENEEDEEENRKAKKNRNRKYDSEHVKKKPKLEVEITDEITVKTEDKRTILEKLQAMQHSNDENSKDKYDSALEDSKDEGYDEPVQWPHQKLEFLKPDKIKDKEGRRPDHPNYDPSTLFVPKSFLDSVSPGVRQWWVLKSDNFDCVLFFKVGKFYEMYHMDADVGVSELGFTYMRGEFAHSGFPEVAFDKMASILVDRGYKVARVEQTETPDMMTERCKKTKPTKFDKVVRREICQITNRGTQVFGSQCEITINHQPSYMLAIAEKNDGPSSSYGISFIDTSIGDFNIGEFSDDKNSSRLLTLLCHHMPVLVIYEKSSLTDRTQKILRTMLANVLKETLPNGESQRATPEKTLKLLAENYFTSENEVKWPPILQSMRDPNDHLGLTPHANYKLALNALGICINYLRKCLLEEKVMPMARYNLYIPPDIENTETDIKPIQQKLKASGSRHMVLDATTLTHLRITGEEFSLLNTLDHCCTKFGKRLLHYWICAPSCDCNVIVERQQAVCELLENYEMLQNMRALLSPLPDIERQLAQIHLFGSKIVAEKHPDGRAIFFEEKQYSKKKLKNFIALLNGFKSLENTIPKLFKDCKSSLLRHLSQRPIPAGQESQTSGGIYPDMKMTLEFFETSFNHSIAADTGVIAPERGVDPDYDAAECKIEAVQQKLKAYLTEQESYFGCRLSYFGNDKKRFQIEVPEKKVHKVTDEYQLEGQRKGSNPVKRYTTDTTRNLLRQMQSAEDERNNVLKDLARRIFEKFSDHYSTWKQCVDCIAYLDVLGSLAEYAHMQPLVCVPKVHPASSKPFIDIEEGYHPCMPTDTYIPNSILLGTKEMAPFSLLTGPNMGGKSTFMRQVGLILVMAQIGAHVPAEKCEFTIIDRIFSRLGAQDDILAGQSTFMVEMSEASLILKHATVHSFVLMDELGRGTATYDGTAIAASVVNYLADLGCRTMFSTHYKNLTDSFGKDGRVQLGHMACMVENEETDDPTEETVTFLYKYTDGACPKSYGFNAAKLAGMPHDVVKRAYELSKEVEAIALKRKIAAKIVAAAVGKTDTEAVEETTLSAIQTLLLQLKSCQI